MILNLDCFKDTLHYIVEHQDMDENNSLREIYIRELYECDELKEYSQNDVYYALCNLLDIGYIQMQNKELNNRRILLYVKNVTPEGQNFYYGTQEPSCWGNLKEHAKSMGKSAAKYIGDTIQKCAVTTTAAIIGNQFINK